MKIELDHNIPATRVEAYTRRSLSIAGRVYTGSVIVGDGRVIDNLLPPAVADMQARHLQAALEMAPEIALFGAGPRLCYPPDEITQILFERRIGMEIMDTGAACRSFNFLLGESRRVVGLLFLDDRDDGQ